MPWASFLHIRESAKGIWVEEIETVIEVNFDSNWECEKLLLGIGQLEGNVMLLDKLPGASAGGRLLAEMQPDLLDCRPKLQSLGGCRHLEPLHHGDQCFEPQLCQTLLQS